MEENNAYFFKQGTKLKAVKSLCFNLKREGIDWGIFNEVRKNIAKVPETLAFNISPGKITCRRKYNYLEDISKLLSIETLPLSLLLLLLHRKESRDTPAPTAELHSHPLLF